MRNRRFNWVSFFIFSLVCFWPVAFYLAIGQGFILLSVLSHPSGVGPGLSLFLLGILILLILPVAVVVGAYNVCSRLEGWKARGWTIYIGWVVVAFSASFVLSAAMGGMSMAVVEGVSGRVIDRYLLYARVTFLMTLISHIAIVPWTLLSVYILRRLEGKVFSVDAGQQSPTRDTSRT
jgi:hypothetical protein